MLVQFRDWAMTDIILISDILHGVQIIELSEKTGEIILFCLSHFNHPKNTYKSPKSKSYFQGSLIDYEANRLGLDSQPFGIIPTNL